LRLAQLFDLAWTNGVDPSGRKEAIAERLIAAGIPPNPTSNNDRIEIESAGDTQVLDCDGDDDAVSEEDKW